MAVGETQEDWDKFYSKLSQERFDKKAGETLGRLGLTPDDVVKLARENDHIKQALRLELEHAQHGNVAGAVQRVMQVAGMINGA